MSVPPFDPDPSENIYVQVADHIAARIAAGDLTPGARLPGERDLASEYRVALGTARNATRLLAERGLIKITPSKGKFVVRPPDDTPPRPKPDATQ